jgi:hypothetical protein
MENIDEIASKSSEIIDDGCGPESYPILYSHLNKVNHNFVPIIHYGKNNHKLDLDRVKAYRQAGTPFVIKVSEMDAVYETITYSRFNDTNFC